MSAGLEAARVRVLRLVLMGFLGLVLLAQGVPVDLLLAGVVLEGLYGGCRWGAAVGLAYGAAQDLVGGTYPGLHILTKTLIGLAAGTAEKRFFRENPLLPVLGLLSATAAQDLAYALGGELIRWGRGFGLPQALWPELFLNTVLGMLLYWLFYSRVTRRQ